MYGRSLVKGEKDVVLVVRVSKTWTVLGRYNVRKKVVCWDTVSRSVSKSRGWREEPEETRFTYCTGSLHGEGQRVSKCHCRLSIAYVV
jgi:hypothetical protein